MRRGDLKDYVASWGESLKIETTFTDMPWFGPIAAIIPSDPYFQFQWHLLNSGQSGGTPGIDINISEVWNDYTGTGVVIGIIDDGVQHSHPDLSANYDTNLDHDARDGDSDAAPGTSVNNHGTTVAGNGTGDAARRLLSDSEGSDTLNAASVTSNSVIDLNPGANSTLAGNSLAIAAGTVIENAYAGDGNDFLTGNSLDNSLHGGRGDDNLSGGGGNDHLVGGSGDDILTGGAGNDYFDAGSGTNTILVGASDAHDTILVGNESESTDTLQFDSGIGLGDVDFTQGGNDLIISLSATHGGGAVTVSNFFAAGGGQRIDAIEFDGGTTVLSVANFTQLSDFPLLINEAPTIDDQGFAVDENVALGTAVSTVAASDPNAGDVLSYAITAGNNGGAFAIAADTGAITVQSALNFETLPAYTLTVQVTDSGLLSDTATLNIGISDINEAPTAGEQSLSVAEDSAVGTVVGTVTASDPDAGDVLSYAITAGNSGGAFSIDAGTGVVTVQGALNFETLPG